jgi:hypothetical protein
MLFSEPQPLPPLKPYHPQVSLDPTIHYTTQSSAYSRLIIGKKLTDKKIEYYEQRKRQLRGETPEIPPKKVNKATRAKDLAAELRRAFRV